MRELHKHYESAADFAENMLRPERERLIRCLKNPQLLTSAQLYEESKLYKKHFAKSTLTALEHAKIRLGEDLLPSKLYESAAGILQREHSYRFRSLSQKNSWLQYFGFMSPPALRVPDPYENYDVNRYIQELHDINPDIAEMHDSIAQYIMDFSADSEIKDLTLRTHAVNQMILDHEYSQFILIRLRQDR